MSGYPFCVLFKSTWNPNATNQIHSVHSLHASAPSEASRTVDSPEVSDIGRNIFSSRWRHSCHSPNSALANVSAFPVADSMIQVPDRAAHYIPRQRDCDSCTDRANRNQDHSKQTNWHQFCCNCTELVWPACMHLEIFDLMEIFPSRYFYSAQNLVGGTGLHRCSKLRSIAR